MNSVINDINRVDKLLYDEGKSKEALSILETLETRTTLTEEEYLRIKILKSYALTVIPDLRRERTKEGNMIAEKAFQESKQQPNQVLFVDALLIKLNQLNYGMYDDDQQLEFLVLIEKGENVLKTTSHLSRTEAQRRLAFLRLEKGSLYIVRGEEDQALQYYQDSLTTFEKLGNKFGMARAQSVLGEFYMFSLRDYTTGIPYFHKSLVLFEELNHKKGIAYCYHRIGVFYNSHGELDQAMKNFQKSYQLYEEIGDYDIWLPLATIGLIYYYRGNLDPALEYQLKSLQVTQKAYIKDHFEIHQTILNVGRTYHVLGQFDKSLKYYHQGLKILTDFLPNRKGNISQCLYYLFSLHFEHELVTEAQKYLQQLEHYSKKADQKYTYHFKLTRLFYRLAKTKMLKTSSKLKDKAEAQSLVEEIITEDTIWHEYTILAKLILCELLLEEIKLSGDQVILENVKQIINEIYEIGQTHHMYPVLVNALILQTKLALLEGNIPDANQRLTQAILLTEEKGLIQLQKIATQEQLQLESQLTTWKDLYQSNAPMYERIAKTKLTEYLIEAQKILKID
ncbi:MAG: Photosystem I assembly protein Ycf3 [Candidatus Heimdallarchaeota archaeon LC_3]|nr:MAG: Photosystem I assembly protein Ycf3 [Candidatus Heimdallarchaeota archaeon LC_3]